MRKKIILCIIVDWNYYQYCTCFFLTAYDIDHYLVLCLTPLLYMFVPVCLYFERLSHCVFTLAFFPNMCIISFVFSAQYYKFYHTLFSYFHAPHIFSMMQKVASFIFLPSHFSTVSHSFLIMS
jgi:hypothetical protein